MRLTADRGGQDGDRADGHRDETWPAKTGVAGTVPLATALRTAVIGAPRTRTLATTVAGARRSAASQVPT